MGFERAYVDVIVYHKKNGTTIPRAIVWEDGVRYIIDRVTGMQPAASLKAGGQGDRYTVLINGRETYLFFEHSTCMSADTGRWFVEKKVSDL